MKDAKQWLQNILIGIVAIAVGVFIFFQTDEAGKVMVLGIGAFVFITGIAALFLAVKRDISEFTRNMLLVRGILGMLAGIVTILLPLANTSISWETMLYIQGGVLAVSAVLLLLSLTGIRKAGFNLTRTFSNIGISAALALIIFLMPRDRGILVLSILAAVIVIYGIILIALGISKRNSMKKPGKGTPENAAGIEDIFEEPKKKKKDRKKAGGKGPDAGKDTASGIESPSGAETTAREEPAPGAAPTADAVSGKDTSTGKAQSDGEVESGKE